MRLYSLLLIAFTTISISKAVSQTTLAKNTFSIKGRIANRDTGLVILWYKNLQNKFYPDSFRLEQGKFKFSGSVNGVCEAMLWTDPKNIDFDDSTVIRFLLEPNTIDIYKINDTSSAIIKGSKVQKEKEEWDYQKSSLLLSKEQCYKTYAILNKESKINNTLILQQQITELFAQIDSINRKLRALDVKYINRHPNSYLSAYLLTRHTRRLPVDTLEILYSRLGTNMKKSTVGKDVLAYIYPVTNNNNFRKLNPLVDSKSNQQLEKVHSIYDLSLKDTTGNTFNLGNFKGKYMLIDFWGTWCGPCIANIPALNQFIKDYGDSIHIISVSLDKDPETWKSSIIKHNFPGIQLSDLKGSEGLIAIYCKVLWVPKYIIVDRQGKIINYDAPQVSNPELKVLLDKLLRPAPEQKITE